MSQIVRERVPGVVIAVAARKHDDTEAHGKKLQCNKSSVTPASAGCGIFSPARYACPRALDSRSAADFRRMRRPGQPPPAPGPRRSQATLAALEQSLDLAQV